jgi:crotonobetainyl-CoA:carnitine CoA-transferase CaiB-like acyl-CoA transferase
VEDYRGKKFMLVKILDNVTVIECATFVTGPYATALLADLGARVIKIESAPDGDPYRYFAPDPAFSFNFAHLNRNKESLVLDLKARLTGTGYFSWLRLFSAL